MSFCSMASNYVKKFNQDDAIQFDSIYKIRFNSFDSISHILTCAMSSSVPPYQAPDISVSLFQPVDLLLSLSIYLPINQS